jgi:adenine-specific DNA-methyltransferase
MSKVEDAMKILNAFGLPCAQHNERSALTLLALAEIPPEGSWKNVRQPLLRIWDIMDFMRTLYGKDYAANSRETIRRQTIHQFEQARIIDRNPDEPQRPTNSGKTVYRLTNEAAAVLKTYGSRRFAFAVGQFLQMFGSLDVAYQHRRKAARVPLRLPNGNIVSLSPGEHNVLQVAVVEKLGEIFATGAVILYIGDTEQKHIVCEVAELAKLNVPITQHDKMPDIVFYDAKRNWLFLIEAVTSHGPVSPKRHQELERLLGDCLAGRVYVSAFSTRADFRKHAADIAWETEVWIAENPEHMIHFNGPKFLGPYVTDTHQEK